MKANVLKRIPSLIPPVLLLLTLPVANGCRHLSDDETSELNFYGADSQSATMKFTTYMEMRKPAAVKTDADIMKPVNLAKVDESIKWQLMHMLGAFTEHPEYHDNPGIVELRRDHVIKSAKIQPDGKTIRVDFDYEDTVVFKKKLLASGPKTIKFVLPRDPHTIYKAGVPAGSSVNKCTDEHYNSEGDFWYFWNPKKHGCPLKAEHLVTVEAALQPIANTKRTYPYYGDLRGDNGNGRTLHMTYLVGIDEDFSAGDLGRQTYDEALQLLTEEGFVASESGGSNEGVVLTKKFPAHDVRIDMRLVDQGGNDFVRAAAEGMEKSDVFIYDGHSGLGGYLNTGRFADVLGRDLKLPKDKHQIFFFNGCSTFSYYNRDYFNLKATAADPIGRSKLDILTTSVGASFSIGARHDVILIKGIAGATKPSWQTILNNMYKVDTYQSALTHVNGDEDNPKVP